jgi:uncharacterized membrane protein YphA (DoxX/SURF4 family)
MQVQEEAQVKTEKTKVKVKEEEAGLFAPLVVAAGNVIGGKELQKLRAQVIKEHSSVISEFVATSDSEFGQNVLKRLFETADKDKNGTVDREELREALLALGFVATSEKDIDKIMKKADMDKNEVIDFEEFKKAAPAVLKNQLTQLAKSNGHELGFLAQVNTKPKPKAAEENDLNRLLKAFEENGLLGVFGFEVSDELQKTATEAAFLFMRIAAAATMFHHGQEVILSADEFTKYTTAKYFGFLPGPDLLWTYVVGYVQLITPILLGLGIFSRASAASLLSIMVAAVYHSKKVVGFEGFPKFELAGLSAKMKYGVASFHNYGFETPALYIGIFLLIMAAGPGKFSLAQLLGWNDDKSLPGKLKQ